MKELIDAYEPLDFWSSRRRLIDVIIDEGTGGSIWTKFRNRWCNNDDTFNIIEGELHGEINKDDPTNPTLSYGVQKNYRCYQMSELEASFRDYDGKFKFAVPDYIDPRSGRQPIIDPTTGAPLISEFPIESIKQLRRLLNSLYLQGNQFDPLIDKIDQGLEELNENTLTVRRMKNQYDQMTVQQQNFIKLYLAWLFMYGMWMRFWKGPGNPWPVTYVNIFNARDRVQQNRCEPGERDEHAFIQQSILSVFRDNYEKDRVLQAWIDALPEVEYNFQTRAANIGRPIKEILDKLIAGNQCMGYAGDQVSQTAYYLIIKMFNLNGAGSFDKFIMEQMPAVLDIERQVVNNQLITIKDPDVDLEYYENAKNIAIRTNRTGEYDEDIENIRRRLAVLRTRQRELANPVINQPSFNPGQMRPNVHT